MMDGIFLGFFYGTAVAITLIICVDFCLLKYWGSKSKSYFSIPFRLAWIHLSRIAMALAVVAFSLDRNYE